MSAFIETNFAHKLYADARPTYPPELYTRILKYHQNATTLAVDLGTGHGIVAQQLAPFFDRVIGTDPSAGMIDQACEKCDEVPNVSFRRSAAESNPFLEDAQVDMVTAATCVHWFDFETFWPEMSRIIRPGGTIAAWAYKHHTLTDYPKANQVLNLYVEGPDKSSLGPFWPQPGFGVLSRYLRDVIPPDSDWCDVERIEYHPECGGLNMGQGTGLMSARITLGAMAQYMRTWSAYHEWQNMWPTRTRKAMDGERDVGSGDIMDEMLEDMVDAEPDLKKRAAEVGLYNVEVNVEYGFAMILARRR